MQENTARRLAPINKVSVSGDLIRVEAPEGQGGPLSLPLMALPDKFVEWIEQGRRSMYDKLLGRGNPGFFTSHLPVMVTQNHGQAFPFNCSNKGVGFLPKPQYLREFTELFRDTLERTRGRHWQESLQERIGIVSRFYFDRDKIEYRALSSLEIFEKGTFNNLSVNPLAALHYTGNAPDYVSFQVNCAVEVIGPDDPRHEFVKLARIMFEYDSFHISQHQFPYAYVFWISGVSDKTPFRVPEKGNVITLPNKGGMKWDPQAVESINRAPGMIRQFITDQIEKYAKERGFNEVSMDLVREAREILERTPGRPGKQAEAEAKPKDEIPAYSKIYVGLDSSGPSNEAMALSVDIAKSMGATMVGSHVYAAKMHDNRFRAMEGGLPEEFQKEKELDKQRKIHDTLITKGLELITDSYIEAMAKACREKDVPFAGVSLEGKNWKAMADDIEANDYDLVALGAHGIGRVSRSQLGTVAERLLRRVKRDVLLCKLGADENPSDTIVVCLDGSRRSWGGLMRGMQLAKSLNKRIMAVSAFDPYFHYAMFKSLNKTLTEKARKVFKFEEQEKLHEDIIDSGLAKIYQSYLNIAKRMAATQGVDLEIKLLDGKPFEKIIQLVNQNPPWLLIVGRIGFHSEEDMDIGGNTENLCRQAPCNILVVDAKAKPPTEYQAEETVSWTKEARAKLDVMPAMAQGMAMKAIQNYCIAEGFTVVTESILQAAVQTLLPPEALKKMGFAPEEKKSVGETHDKIALSFKCQACGHVHHGTRPQLCPICGMGGHMFKLLESTEVKDGAVLETLGDRDLIWEKPALIALEEVVDHILRQQIRNSLEKKSLTQRLSAVTEAMVREELRAVGASPAAPADMGLLWSEAAVLRLERVPQGFMRNAAKTMVEAHAQALGASEITLDIAEGGLSKAREKMQGSAAGMSHPGAPGSAGPAHAEAPKPGPGVNADPGNADVTQESPSWECHMCGIVVDGEKPAACGNCHTGHFTRMPKALRAKAQLSALRALDWDEDAKQRLDRVPGGFIRDMTRWRVEKWTRANGGERVTFAIMDGKYGSWGAGSAKFQTELTWNEAAAKRAEKIPEFIRPMVMKEIERRAKAAGRDSVGSEDMDQAMKHWSDSGNFHSHG